ncbi:MAG: TfoX/Sxy family protein [Kineosporiaceae bacterium]|nr:TfoX/Sxy family protein [Kineosporiaceae bacterium]
MPFDPEIADRLRLLLQDQAGLREQRMFGGVAFMIHGNLAVAASSQGGILLRVDPGDADALAARPHARRFVMRGRELAGWLHVEPGGVRTEEDLAAWTAIGLAHVHTLPPK